PPTAARTARRTAPPGGAARRRRPATSPRRAGTCGRRAPRQPTQPAQWATLMASRPTIGPTGSGTGRGWWARSAPPPASAVCVQALLLGDVGPLVAVGDAAQLRPGRVDQLREVAGVGGQRL